LVRAGITVFRHMAIFLAHRIRVFSLVAEICRLLLQGTVQRKHIVVLILQMTNTPAKRGNQLPARTLECPPRCCDARSSTHPQTNVSVVQGAKRTGHTAQPVLASVRRSAAVAVQHAAITRRTVGSRRIDSSC